MIKWVAFYHKNAKNDNDNNNNSNGCNGGYRCTVQFSLFPAEYVLTFPGSRLFQNSKIPSWQIDWGAHQETYRVITWSMRWPLTGRWPFTGRWPLTGRWWLAKFCRRWLWIAKHFWVMLKISKWLQKLQKIVENCWQLLEIEMPWNCSKLQQNVEIC